MPRYIFIFNSFLQIMLIRKLWELLKQEKYYSQLKFGYQMLYVNRVLKTYTTFVEVKLWDADKHVTSVVEQNVNR